MKVLRTSMNIALGCLLAVGTYTMASGQKPGRGSGGNSGKGKQGTERSYGSRNNVPGRGGNGGADNQREGADNQRSGQAYSDSAKGDNGQEVSARRRAAIQIWKASGVGGPPPWAGKGGGPGGNPNRPGKGQQKGRNDDKRKGPDKD